MQSCGMNIIKYILFVFNVFFAISGLGILIAGALVLSDINEFNYFLEGRVTAPPIVLIVTGAIIFLIASLGCYGAIRESPSMLYAFAFLLLIIFIVELAVGIAACVFKSDLQMMLQKSLQDSIERSSMDDIMAWDNVQQKLQCCGINGASDWQDFSRNHTIRASCCRPNHIDGTKDCKNGAALFQHRYYQDGCLPKLKSKIDSNAVVLIGVGLGLAFVQLLGIVLACWLASAIRRENAK
ncbi:23 kDa integral membrane protein [Bradysia coprophila]|uniref:23 kDa integral membrane protein n=1 Tax=Bradysia coprophila TaxID=38358 RepID=UPI00187DA329|nr:23 kDa integral membrane protein [Bradysia coprophila]XP_037035112.1 23 kDa integral membrane protein [Bradysia coprophila]